MYLLPLLFADCRFRRNIINIFMVAELTSLAQTGNLILKEDFDIYPYSNTQTMWSYIKKICVEITKKSLLACHVNW